jgi:hypothetical protein
VVLALVGCLPPPIGKRGSNSGNVRGASPILSLSSVQRFSLGSRKLALVGTGRPQAQRRYWLGVVFDTVAKGDQEDSALAFGVWREKAGHIIVVKSETSSSQAMGVSSQIQFAAQDAGF